MPAHRDVRPSGMIWPSPVLTEFGRTPLSSDLQCRCCQRSEEQFGTSFAGIPRIAIVIDRSVLRFHHPARASTREAQSATSLLCRLPAGFPIADGVEAEALVSRRAGV